MITFQGNKQILKSAQMLESRARNTYPHISTSKIRKQIGYDTPDPAFFKSMKKDYRQMRQMIKESGDYYSSVIQTLSYGKLGNCTEQAMFTEILGKINGQNNIYTGSVGLSRDNQQTGYLNHVVAFITDKPIEVGKDFFCKNKDAIIIDPWLGITDFAGNYFTKLKTIYRKIFTTEPNKRFTHFTNDNLAYELLRKLSKTPKDFNEKRKDFFPNTRLCVIPFIDKSLNKETIEILKQSFPELVIKNFKKIKFSATNSKITKTDKIA